MTEQTKIPFLKKFKIYHTKFPKYPEFHKPFTITIDKFICSELLKTPDNVIEMEIKNEFLKVHNHIKDGKLTINHFQNYGVGRFYSTNNISLVPHSKKIKHTILKYMKWNDIDMKKGHPTIAVEIFKRNGIELPHIKNYIENFTNIADALIEYYGIEGEIKPTQDQIKWCFNMMLYGGGFDGWVKSLKEGNPKKGYKPVNLKNIDTLDDKNKIVPHEIIRNFKRECWVVGDTIFKNNFDLVNKLVKPDEQLEEYEKKNRLTSYFFQAVENHMLYLLYTFLVDKRIVEKQNCELEYDGLCIPPVPFDFNKEDLVNEINSMILEKTGLNVLFCFKGYDNNFVQQQVIDYLIANPIVEASVIQPTVVEGEEVAEYHSTNTNINWDLSEAEFAKTLKSVCFKNKPVVFTGKDREMEGYIFNGIFWNALSIHNAELQQTHFDNLYKFYKENLKLEKTRMPEKLYNSLVPYIKTLNSNKTRKNVIEIFKKDNYIEKVEWNKNINLFVFDDKVYDLSIGRFVKPNQEDYMNMSVGYKYEISNLAPERYNEVKMDIGRILKSIIEGDEEYNHIMKVLSTFLLQDNKEEKAYFWLGAGRNGKGTMTTLLKRVLGLYWGELNTEYYTTYKHRADEPNQNLYNCRNSRVLNTSEVAQENSRGEAVKFVNDNFTRLTGRDSLCPRELGSKKTACFQAGKPLIQLNSMPSFTAKINANSDSLRQRVEIHDLKYTFTEDENLLQSNPEKYKRIDKSLKDKFKTDEYRSVMVDILFDYYKLYMQTGLVPPTSITNHTKKYFNDLSLTGWVNNNYTATAGSKVSLDTVQRDYEGEFNRKIGLKKLQKELKEAGLVVKQGVSNSYFLIGYTEQTVERVEEIIWEGDEDE